MKYKPLYLLFFLLAFSFGICQNVFGQVGVRVTPFRIEETVKPGETLTKIITVTNVYDEQKTFYTYVKDFIASGEGGDATLIPADSEKVDSLTDWVVINSDGIELEPGERKEVPIIFNIPEVIGPGGYYGAIIFGPQPPETEPGGGTVISLAHQVGVLALLNVEGEAYEEAVIREFSTDENIYNTPFTVNFLTRVNNLGNTHIKPRGVIEIENMRGTRVTDLNINHEGVNVLPQTVRRFNAFWQDDFGIGRYKATLVLTFGTSPAEGGLGIRTISAETYFWIIPWGLVYQVLAGILVLSLIILIIFRRSKEKAIKQLLKESKIDDPTKIKKEKNPSKVYFNLIILIVLVLVILIFGMIFFLFFL